MKKDYLEIRQKLNDQRIKSAEEALKLSGIDIKAFRKLEQETDKQFGDIIDSLHKLRIDEANEVVERHQEIQKQRKEIIRELSGVEALLCLSSPLISKCRCDYDVDVTRNEGNSKGDSSEIITDPPGGVPETQSINYDTNLNQAQPYVKISGGGVGSHRSATINAWYKFHYRPAKDGKYCINPSIFMNGWWLLWIWSSSCENPVPGGGEIKVKIFVKVDQQSAEVGRIEHSIIDEVSTGGDAEGPIDYASDVDGGSRLIVNLVGDRDAVIFVGFEIYAEVNVAGRAIIDLQSSREFYFKVPSVAIGLRTCRGPILCTNAPFIKCPPSPEFGLLCPPSPSPIECPPAPEFCIGAPTCIHGPDPRPDFGEHVITDPEIRRLKQLRKR